MKPASIIAILFSLVNFGHAQITIAGLGEFKLGKTTTYFIDSLRKAGHSYTTVNKYSDAALITNYDIVEGICNEDPNLSPFPCPYISSLKTFTLYNYKLLDLYKTESLILYFYKNVLVYVSVYKPDMQLYVDLLAKYGQPEHRQEKSNLLCDSKADEITLSTWRDTLNRRTLKFRYGFNYNSDCNINETSGVSVSSNAEFIEVSELNRNSEARKKEKYKRTTLEKL